jgi:multisubunit Na+/H+ antiporter MnhE subunit
MAKWTMTFGVLLIVVSLAFWLGMGRSEMAALHPAGVGLVLVVCGLLANTEDGKKRMLWMHVGVTVGLIGFLITGVRAVITLAKGAIAVAPGAFAERVVVAAICAAFVGRCVRSFIAARRARTV